jgi:hypothetical protein
MAERSTTKKIVTMSGKILEGELGTVFERLARVADVMLEEIVTGLKGKGTSGLPKLTKTPPLADCWPWRFSTGF